MAMTNAERQAAFRKRKKEEAEWVETGEIVSDGGREHLVMTPVEIQSQLRLIALGKTPAKEGQVSALKALEEISRRRADADNEVLKGMASDLRDWSSRNAGSEG